MSNYPFALICAAGVAATLAAGLATADAAPRARLVRGDVPPFCVLVGGPRGVGTIPQICRFFDFQQCLEAAAVLHGNCVINIDYRGVIPATPGPW